MGAIRIVVQSLPVRSAAFAPFSVVLDCWRATLRINCEDAAWNLDGWDVSRAFTFDPTLLQSNGQFFSLGGLVIDGKPVNMNRTLNFTPTALGRLLFGVVILEYWDRNLPDPQAHDGHGR
jgi:hypothetical protein